MVKNSSQNQMAKERYADALWGVIPSHIISNSKLIIILHNKAFL
jgi:hypothetical protein